MARSARLFKEHKAKAGLNPGGGSCCLSGRDAMCPSDWRSPSEKRAFTGQARNSQRLGPYQGASGKSH